MSEPVNKGGRPSLYTPELIESIAARLALGEPMAQICRDEGMPAYRTVKDWIDTKPEVAAVIARARDDGEDVLAAECLAIADKPREGEETKYDADGNLVERKVGDMLGHRKLQIDTRLKLLAKWNPKKYGDKTQLDHTSSDGSMKPPSVVQLVGPSGDGTSTTAPQAD